MTPGEWAGRALAAPDPPATHLSKGGRTAAVDVLITVTAYSRAVVSKRKQIALGSRVVGSTVAASPSSSATPQPSQLTCCRLCWQHQPEPGSLSQLLHESPCFIPGWDESTSLPPSVVYGDAKSSLRLVVLLFQEKKKKD